MRITILSTVFSGALIMAAGAPLQSPTGTWRTFDDKTGKPKGIVQIYEDNGKLFGKLERSLDPQGKKTCEKCTDDRKGKPMAGLLLIRNMEKHGGEYSGGDILDPDNGTVYRCKMKVIEGGAKLSVRGFIGVSLLGRSQTWTREPQ